MGQNVYYRFDNGCFNKNFIKLMCFLSPHALFTQCLQTVTTVPVIHHRVNIKF